MAVLIISLTLPAIRQSLALSSSRLRNSDWKVIISPKTEATSSEVIRLYSFKSPFLVRS